MELLPLLSPATFHGLITVPNEVPPEPVDHRLKITEQGAQFTPGQKSNESTEIQFACKKMSQELVIQDGSGCLLPAAGLQAKVPFSQKLKRSTSPARQRPVPSRNRLMERSLNSPSGCKKRTAIKSVCQVTQMHTFLLLSPARNRDYVMLTAWLRNQHLVSWTTSSAAVSLRRHLRNGHKIQLILPPACETDTPYRRLAK